ncbi:elongation factor 1-gamma [Linderina pennispora]|uniref:Elongation factor 1-gamma n=1 Tax=Linderina pennispora TaxID=61395 RepID=A0A1Y1W835_9FUNG|nr:elongation factor 1-gamma [Linderina pennispora]ORX69679.1 elongation factor 1-gamma [Linderina pennispora]
MTSLGTLHAPLANFRAYKARVVASFLSLPLDLTPDFVLHTDNRTSEYLAKFPAGKVPAFEGTDGFRLADSSAIAYYIASKAGADSPLLGQTAEETAEILQYILSAEADFLPASLSTVGPLIGFLPFIKPAHQVAEEQTLSYLDGLNRVLLDRTFLVGERITVADIVLACDLILPFRAYLTDADRRQFRNVTRYFKTIISQPAFKAVVPSIELCKERPKPATPVKNEKTKKEKAKKAEKPKAEKPKAEKKAEKPAEEAPKPAPKPKSKLDLLPPPKMVLDDWKRFYSNNDTKPDAVNWLWEHFDEEGYSFWKVEYKYNDELTKIFMSNNLVGGFFNRLERARKYAFGNLLVLGQDSNNQIWGYFMLRGQEVPEEVTDAADYESYTWTKVDHKDPKTKAEIEDCFAWEGSALPREFADGKTFK